MPNTEKSAQLSGYRFIAQGNLKGGLSYEDYRSDDNGVTEVVRYYFDGNILVKIAAASDHKNSDGKIDGRRCIIKIQEFSSVPDKSLLKLPEGVKDETKRKKH